MEPCVTCGNVEPVVPVPTGGCECETPGGDPLREVRLLAPTRHEYEYWAANDPVIPEGVICIVKDRLFEGSREYIISNSDTDKFSDLTPMAGAPLSRTGKANHSPLAASGKSTLDPSWLPAATSSALGAVMVSTTGAAGKVPIPANGSFTLDSSWLPVSTSGAANKIPIAGDNGKLDPTWFPEATSTALGAVKASTTTAANNVVKADANGSLDGWKDAIVGTIENENGGLVVDPNTGDLMVDFSQMPIDKFEALLKGSKMQIPLEANLNLYVDQNHANASDTIEDGRGTQAKPFKTINACVAYATQTYAVGKYTIYINVAQGTYNETVSLPFYTRTSGSIVLRATDYDAPPTITNAGPITTPVQVSGGSMWTIRRINVICEFSAPNDSFQHFPGCIHAGGNSFVTIQGCALSATYSGDAHSAYLGVRMLFAASGSTITLGTLAGYQNSFTCHKGNASAAMVLMAEHSGAFNIPAANTPDDGIMYNIPCSGEMSVFAYASSTSTLFITGGATYFQQFTGSMTGTRYRAVGGSNITAPSNGFPGDVDGSVDTATYAWYSGPSL